MKRISRVLCMFFSFLMLFSVMSCSRPEVESFDADFSDGSFSGLSGMELTIACYFDSTNGAAVGDNVLGYNTGTNLADLAVARIKQTEKDLDCKINNVYMADYNNRFSYSISVGQSLCDISFVPSMSYYSWMKAGYLSPLSSVKEYIDYTDSAKWGTPMLLECLCYKDDLYGLLPAAWPDLVYTSFGYPLVANINLITTAGGDDPRELYEQGVWNWDTFSEQIQKCTVIEGGETLRWGLGGHTPYLSEMIFRSNGTSLTRVDGKISLTCGYYVPESLKAIEYVRLLCSGDLSYTYHPDTSVLGTVDAFCNNKVCYSFNPVQYIYGVFGEISRVIENFAVLRTPVGPDVDANYAGGVYHAMNYTISFPSNVKDIAASAIVADRIFEPFEEYKTFEDIKAYMTHNNFFDSRDADAFFDICFNSNYNYFYTAGAGARAIPENAPNMKKSPAELIETYRNSMDQMFEEQIGDTISGYLSVFGEE